MVVRLFAVLLLLGWSAAAAAQVEYPPLTGRVVDRAEILPPQTEAALDARLAEHERATSNQVVVATIASLDSRDIESYANGLFRAWQLGQEERDNGLLLLVAPNEREVRIEVGYGLEGTMTDALASIIIRNDILPHFREGDLPGGVQAGVDAVLAALQGSYQAEPADRRPDDVRSLLPFLLFILWGGFIFFRSRRRRRRRGPWGYPVIYGGHGWGGHRGGFGGGGFGGGFGGGGGSSGGGGASGRW